MVSAEGACAAYYAYGRHLEAEKKERASGKTLEVLHDAIYGSASSSAANPTHAVAAPNDWREKVMHKCRESIEVKQKFFDHYADEIGELAQKMADRFRDGHKLWVLGNGGSACDAHILPSSSFIQSSKRGARCLRSIWSARYRYSLPYRMTRIMPGYLWTRLNCGNPGTW